MPVKIYSREGCAPCYTLKYWLNKKGVKYEEFPAEDYMRVVPLIKIGDMEIEGANLGYIAELLKI